MIGGLSLIERRANLADDQQRILGMTKRAAEQGSELVRRLLAFARRQKLEPHSINLVSLQEAVSSCGWRLGISGAGHDELCEKVAGVIAAPSLVVTRKRKGKVVTDDIRPGILALRVVEGVEVECELAAQPRAVRPGELVRAIDPGLEEAWVRRTNQWIERDGARGVPLHATDAQHVRLAGARAR